MPKYKCENPKCKKLNLTQIVDKITIKIIEGDAIDSGSICPECKKVMEDITTGFPTAMHGHNICNK